MSSAVAAYNFTISHTSARVSPYGFDPQCPVDNGIVRCSGDDTFIYLDPISTTGQGNSSFTVYFAGTAIYLYGSVKDNVDFTTRLIANGGKPALGDVAGTPEGNLIAKYEGLTMPVPGSEHQVSLTVPWTFGSRALTFSHAEVRVDGSATQSGEPARSTFTPDQDSVQLISPDSWTKNASYWQATPGTNQVVNFDFEGDGVFLYGLCTDIGQKGLFLGGDPKIDGVKLASSGLPHGGGRPIVVDDCLVTYMTGLGAGKHNFSMDTDGAVFLISRFEVVKFPGIAMGAPTGDNNSTTPSDTKDDAARGLYGNRGGVVAGVAAGLFGALALLGMCV